MLTFVGSLVRFLCGLLEYFSRVVALMFLLMWLFMRLLVYLFVWFAHVVALWLLEWLLGM